MNKGIIILLSIICLIKNTLANDKISIPQIYINQLVSHPALDSTTKGIIDGLSQLGYTEGKINLKIENAQGNVAISNQIANKFVSNNADIVIGVATIASQSFIKYTKQNKTKLVYTSITDPAIAGLNSVNITGVSNFIPLEDQIELFLRIKPSIKKLGFLYNPGELNSVSILKQLNATLKKYNIELVEEIATKSSDVLQSTIKLCQIADAIFISNDNTALSAFQTITKIARNHKIPVFVSDTDIVYQGAIAALGANQYELGKQTSKLIARILNGENINNIKPELVKKTSLVLNSAVADKLGISIPEDLIQTADTCIK